MPKDSSIQHIEELPHSQKKIHEHWMEKALLLADQAEQLGEVPIGAVVVYQDAIIGEGYNLRETQHCALAHAEMIAIDEANKYLHAWRLDGATLYVTLEPCPMCAGAIINSRIQTVVYGAKDPKAGSAGTLMNLLMDERLNHQSQIIEGVYAETCGEKLTQFFRKLRKERKNKKVIHKTVDNLEN
ncbi:tRNA adenosine(34) deaminase TadA [Aerococcaceae bacterium DSM 111020]|nr:tRNA adenosine(34) deaminase TadA [Aerococcaceae bacterium DSM 111020]